MCQLNKVVVNGDKEILTPNEFEAHFGVLPLYGRPAKTYKSEMLGECLCPWDLERTFKHLNIPFRYEPGEGYFVEQSALSNP